MIIGLCGKAGAGKDAFADRLVEAHGFVKRGFASPLYEEVAQAFGVEVEWLKDRSRKEQPQTQLMLNHCLLSAPEFAYQMLAVGVAPTMPLSPRRVLQWWGTEYRRAQSLTYWVDQMRAFCDRHPDVVITDTRFENEAMWVHEQGGIVVQIHRAGLIPVEGEHASAKGLPLNLINYTLHNNQTLARFELLADEFLSYLEGATEAA